MLAKRAAGVGRGSSVGFARLLDPTVRSEPNYPLNTSEWKADQTQEPTVSRGSSVLCDVTREKQT